MPLGNDLVFLNRAKVDIAQFAHFRLDFANSRVGRPNGDFPPQRRRVFVGQFVFFPNMILHGGKLHFELGLLHFLLMNALGKVARAG